MYKLKKVIVLVAGILSAVSHVYAAPVLAAPGNITVTEEDIARYIVENVPEDKRTAVLNRSGIFQEMAETLYILRTLAAEAEVSPDFDKEQAAWSAQVKYERSLVSNYRRAYILRELADVDWVAAAEEKYRAESTEFMTGEQIRASHILISTEQRTGGEAKSLASDIRRKLTDGEDFSTLAEEYTDDAAGKQNGGDLGYFGRGRMVASFEEAAFAMRESGEISEIVKSPFGYHIILLVEYKPAEQIPFDKVKDEIITEIQSQRGGQVWQEKVIAIRSSKNLQWDQELLDKLSAQYKPTDSE